MTPSGLERFVRKQERLLCEPKSKEAVQKSSVQAAADRRTSAKTHGTGVSETCLCIHSHVSPHNPKQNLKTRLMYLVRPDCCPYILLHH